MLIFCFIILGQNTYLQFHQSEYTVIYTEILESEKGIGETEFPSGIRVLFHAVIMTELKAQ